MLESIWKELVELSGEELNEEASFDEVGLDIHYGKHGEELGVDKPMYKISAESLSEYPGSALENPITYNEVYGYIAQNGRKYKFTRVKEGTTDLAIYVGDDITGKMITFYRIPFKRLMFRLNPYFDQSYGQENSVEDMRYKCDLDGGLKGFEVIKPDFKHPASYSKEKCDEIKQKIHRGESI